MVTAVIFLLDMNGLSITCFETETDRTMVFVSKRTASSYHIVVECFIGSQNGNDIDYNVRAQKPMVQQGLVGYA